ncbi:hypothetical protein T265_06017 [Opisthorchis viverrini]|uniref:Uncharacterized protein n=1 Tax=Opisthorchis viverrini TaxID=6198 RepID=A0A074ZTU4_OPIVI|nr:hypothetical protein T265_06017 [Opisthorchis viverrini]KER26805.1 hypothetical protein T265_06017 [Opisthorchis viverrini]
MVVHDTENDTPCYPSHTAPPGKRQLQSFIQYTLEATTEDSFTKQQQLSAHLNASPSFCRIPASYFGSHVKDSKTAKMNYDKIWTDFLIKKTTLQGKWNGIMVSGQFCLHGKHFTETDGVSDHRCLWSLAQAWGEHRASNSGVRRMVSGGNNSPTVDELTTLRWLGYMLRILVDRLPQRTLFAQPNEEWKRARGSHDLAATYGSH